ncbi:hypothetical protein RUM43_003623 [Polyplax serrata]|uniref:Uncharacterized protein n=1 Tax=Polyplax serrata TaxID=468196 RepID=A0AAN8PF29_POLSC
MLKMMTRRSEAVPKEGLALRAISRLTPPSYPTPDIPRASLEEGKDGAQGNKQSEENGWRGRVLKAKNTWKQKKKKKKEEEKEKGENDEVGGM